MLNLSNLLNVKDYYTNLTNNLTNNYSTSLGGIKEYCLQMYKSKLIIFLVMGIIISFIFFSILSFLFKTPFIILVGLGIGYGMYKIYNNYSNDNNNSESFINRYY
jgi:hypothetical protein|tara:strand:+ start:153 stop:467 length:315 start_codon:yes stop_codon:yes gene_type:complete